METEIFTISVNLPTHEEFGERFPQYGKYASNEGRFLFERIVSPECFISARAATLDLQLPALAGIADICYQLVKDQGTLEWRGFIKQFIGAVVCKLMEDNGFEKTGRKRSVPHSNFTKGEVYRLADDNK
ncbi:MAG: hypothetical protein U9R53_09965 [Chloroflexota bacterium]|nr:hypothetical protein [Chloroflexota bacterium]